MISLLYEIKIRMIGEKDILSLVKRINGNENNSLEELDSLGWATLVGELYSHEIDIDLTKLTEISSVEELIELILDRQ